MKCACYVSVRWDYVKVPNNCNVKKLEIIEHCELNTINSVSDDEVIYNAYNLVLLKLGQYSIYKLIIDTLNLSDNPMNWL